MDKIKVLTVDDDESYARSFNDYLKTTDDIIPLGYAVDGEEAYEMILETQPDVVVLDMILPRLDGIGVLRKTSASELKTKPLFLINSHHHYRACLTLQAVMVRDILWSSHSLKRVYVKLCVIWLELSVAVPLL